MAFCIGREGLLQGGVCWARHGRPCLSLACPCTPSLLPAAAHRLQSIYRFMAATPGVFDLFTEA